jgi:hypothetical protein
MEYRRMTTQELKKTLWVPADNLPGSTDAAELSKLISGQICVPGAEAMLAWVVG